MDKQKNLRLKAVAAAISRTANVLHQDEWRHKVIDRYNELKKRTTDTHPDPNSHHYMYAKEEISLLQSILINL